MNRTGRNGQELLLVFLKYPTPGTVKTRLASSLGPEVAGRVYRLCAGLTLKRLASFRERAILYVDPQQALPATRQWLGSGWALRPQVGTTLGERLVSATDEAFSLGARRVVVIGTDSPWMQPPDVTEAFAALHGADVVIGPAEDGGYYLIGFSRKRPALFERMAWSSPRLYAQTRQKAERLGLGLTVLRRGYDVDYAEDVRRFVEEERWRGGLSPMVRSIERLIRRPSPAAGVGRLAGRDASAIPGRSWVGGGRHLRGRRRDGPIPAPTGRRAPACGGATSRRRERCQS